MVANDLGPLAVGVTGHRLARLEGTDLAALATRIAGVLAACEAAAPGARFRLVGSLAEGADTIAADAALARDWQLDTVLPFACEEYARDFGAADAAAGLRARVAQSTNVFELPGTRAESGGAAAAYERAGRIVLAQSDLLIAIWDGDPPRGRGGAAQIVAEAVGQGIPVLTLHPDAARAPVLLWSGLNAHEFGPESVDTVAQGGLGDLPRMFSTLVAGDVPAPRARGFRAARLVRPAFAFAYPLLLAVSGVRRLRLADFRRPRPPAIPDDGTDDRTGADSFDGRIAHYLHRRFVRADFAASAAAQLFRSAFVSNFALAAIAVTLSLFGLVIPAHWKPLLVLGEFASIATILSVTSIGARAGWHRRWLEQRRLAEHLRCLAVSARLGDIFLRRAGGEGGPAEARRIARGLGLPSARVDGAYLAATHASFLALLDDQIGYFKREAHRMHLLEHRLHRFGGVLFALTALLCVTVLAIEGLGALLPQVAGEFAHGLPAEVTIASTALPASGASIYGIRMQGDFAGAAERNAALAAQLAGMHRLAVDEVAAFDTLRRMISRTADLLVSDVSQWFQASRARPLALPG